MDDAPRGRDLPCDGEDKAAAAFWLEEEPPTAWPRSVERSETALVDIW